MDGRTINLKEVEDIVRFECGEWEGLAKTIIKRLEALPTVDAVPVRHGRWKWNGEAFICSACGNGHKGQPTIMGQPMFEFCPMCGADMRKDGDYGKAD